MKKVLMILLICTCLISCKTIDIETKESINIEEENIKLREELENAKKTIELYTKEEEYEYSLEPTLIPVKEYIVIDKKDYTNNADEKKVSGKAAVKQSFKDSIVELKDFTGGMSEFDYDINYQYPIFTKKLSMTTIILNSDEVMTTEDVYLSDSKSWEITADIWPSPEGDKQLIFLKPKIDGLETDMVVVTNKRLYKFILYSTKADYQPLVKFRYPAERKFITSNTKKLKAEKIVTSYGEGDPELMSFNYKISIPIFQKKVSFVPELVYDDGSFTYIKLPEEVLQKEIPVLYENSREIVNYEIHPTQHNLLVINKLIEKLTLRIGNSKIMIEKKKGEPKPITVRR